MGACINALSLVSIQLAKEDGLNTIQPSMFIQQVTPECGVRKAWSR
jgi:hypothetical protein